MEEERVAVGGQGDHERWRLWEKDSVINMSFWESGVQAWKEAMSEWEGNGSSGGFLSEKQNSLLYVIRRLKTEF